MCEPRTQTHTHTVFVSVSVMWTYHVHPQNVCYWWLNRSENCTTAWKRVARANWQPTDRQTHEEKRNAHQRFSIKRNVNVLTGEPQTFSVAALVQCAWRNYLTGWFRKFCTINPLHGYFFSIVVVVDRPIGNMFFSFFASFDVEKKREGKFIL